MDTGSTAGLYNQTDLDDEVEKYVVKAEKIHAKVEAQHRDKVADYKQK